MTEDELIERLRERSKDPRRVTSAASGLGDHWIHAEIFPPAPADVVRDALERFGFPLPTLLVRIWSEVANGGIGPGYGIYGLEGGLTHELNDLPLPNLWLLYLDDPTGIELIGEKSAPKSFPMCSWGCCNESWIDCWSSEGNMILITDQGVCIDQGVSFASWIEDWLEGIDVGADRYRVQEK
jgi:hypothetical protein